MPNYVESGYSKGYVEGDNTSSSAIGGTQTSTVDSGAILAELALVKQQNIDLNTKLDAILDAISTNKTIAVNHSQKLVDLTSSVLNYKDDLDAGLSNLVTKEYIDKSVPFVDDMNVKVFRKGTQVNVVDYKDYGTIVSSHFLPSGDFDYTVVYSVEFMIDDVANVSSFLSQQVALYVAP